VSSPSVERWIDDYRSEGVIEWPEGLRDALREAARKPRRTFRFWILIGPANLGMGVVMIPVSILLNTNGWQVGYATAGLSVFGLVVGLCSLPFASLLGNDAQKLVRLYKQANDATQIEIFRRGEHVDEYVTASNAIGRPIDLSSSPSHLLISPPHALHVGSVVDDQVFPVLPPCPVAVRNLAAVETTTDASRTFTMEEKDELRKHIRSLGASSWQKDVMTVMGLAGANAALLGVNIIQSRDALLLACAFVLLAIVIHRYTNPGLKRRRLRASLEHDLADDAVWQIAWPSLRAEIIAEGGTTDDLPDVPPEFVERLPNSKLIWTVDGIPAPWRRAT
jgi:hypothetical protein